MRQLALIAAKLTVSLTLLYFTISRFNFSTISDRLNRLELTWILAAVLIAFVQIGLGALRWRRIVVACGAALSFPQAVRLLLIAAFFNQVLPSTVGGDAARIWLLARSGAGWWKATYSVLLDRFVGVLMLATLVALGLYWSFGLIADPVARAVLLFIGLGSIAGGAAFLALGSWQWLARWNPTRHLANISGIARKLLCSRETALQLVILSVTIHIMTAALTWSIANAVAARIEFWQVFLLVLPVMLVATIPISIAGWGVRESALVLAFSYANLPESEGLIISVLFGGVMFVVGIIGGVAWLASPDTRRISPAWTAEHPPP